MNPAVRISEENSCSQCESVFNDTFLPRSENMKAYAFDAVFRRLKREKKIEYSKDIANEIGLPVSTLNEWEHGARPLKIEYIKLIADYFGVSFEYMIFGEESDQVIAAETREQEAREQLEQEQREFAELKLRYQQIEKQLRQREMFFDGIPRNEEKLIEEMREIEKDLNKFEEMNREAA